MDSSVGIQIAFWIGLILGGLFCGVVCGVVPFIVGIKRKQHKLGLIALIVTIVVGLIFGYRPAIVSALIFTVVILFRKQNQPLVEAKEDVNRS